MDPNAFSLLSVPTPWLSQLVFRHLDKQSRQHICCACKLLRNLGFSQADRVICRLHTSELEPAEAASSLQLLTRCREGADVKLVVQDDHDLFDHAAAEEFTDWLRMLCSHASMAPGLPLHHVTCVELQGHVLGALVPLELIACPNMKHLIRKGCFSSAGRLYVACAQLQRLTMRNPYVQAISDSTEEQLKEQFQGLPNLHHLECIYDGNDQAQLLAASKTVPHLMLGIQVLNQQLTHVTISSHASLGALGWMMEDSSWPQLRALHVPQMGLFEGDLELFLEQMPLLAELGVGILGPHCVTHPSCSVKALSVGRVFMRDLACMPVAGLHTLRIGKVIIKDDDQQHINAARGNLASIAHVIPIGPAGALGLAIQAQENPSAAHLSLLQLMPHDAICVADTVLLSTEWLQLLAQLRCRTLLLAPQSLTPPQWGTLLLQLPSVRTLHLVFHEFERGFHQFRVPDASALGVQLCTLCMTAPRPITVRVAQRLVRHLGTGWRALLDTCLQACNPKHVTLEVVDDDPLHTDW